LLVLLDHTKTWLAVVTALTFSYFRDFHVLYTILGAIIITIIAKTLKLIIRQPRPSTAPATAKPLVPNYGMPSTHSSSIMYFATYISLHLFAKQLDPSSIFLLLLILGMTSLSVVWSRVELGHHTYSQVIAGMILGCVYALAWDAWWRLYWWPWLVGMGIEGKIGWSEIRIFIS